MRDHSNHSDPTGGRRRGGVGLDTGPQRRVDATGPTARGPIDPGMVDITGQFRAIVGHEAGPELFADLDEFDGYDDVTGPLDRPGPDTAEDPEFWVDRTPTSSLRVTETLQAIRTGRSAATGPTSRPTGADRSMRRPRTAGAGPRRPRTGGPTGRLAGLPGLGSPFSRRLVVIAAVVLLAAPIVSALRPTGADAEVSVGAATVAVGTAPSTDAAADAILLNPGAGQAQVPTGTIDMDALPLLTRPGQSGSAAATAQAACSGRYTVVSGDSWSLIADKVSVSLSSLLDVNDATTRTVLHVGDELCLPQGASAPTTNAPPTTKAPSTTVSASPTTVAAPSGPYYSPAQVEAIIRDVWPDNLEDTAIMIAIRESKLNPYVHNWCCYGLFQIYWEVHDVWLIPRGITSASQLYDPRTNATVAYWVYQRSGSFAPWGM